MDEIPLPPRVLGIDPGLNVTGYGVLEAAVADYPTAPVPPVRVNEGFEALRWFALPHEVQAELTGNGTERELPFPIGLR